VLGNRTEELEARLSRIIGGYDVIPIEDELAKVGVPATECEV
jgi:hypothetical protein